jgi:hypothetical protein
MLLQLELDEDEARIWKARLYEYRQRYLDCEMQIYDYEHLFISPVVEDRSDDTEQVHPTRQSPRQLGPRIVQTDEWVSQPPNGHALSTVDAKFLTDFCDLIKSKFTHVPQISGEYKVYLMMKFVPTGTPASDPHVDLHKNNEYWTFTFNCNYEWPPLFTTDGFNPPPKWKRKRQKTWPLALGFDGTELHFAKEQTDEYKNCMFAHSDKADQTYGLRFFVVLCPKGTKDPNIKDLSILQRRYTFD